MVTVASLLFTALAVQLPAGPTPDELAAMRKFDFLVGNWQGEGWFLQRDGSRLEFSGTETVQTKLQGRALLVEGLFNSKKNGDVIHNTLAVITFDPGQKTHLMRANLFNMPYGEHKVTPTADGFAWDLSGPNSPPIRYTATVKDGVWVEVGEVSLEGRPKIKFFEMTLKRLPASAK